jgi:1,4-dihydroxy-2-naphthoate octaprenyltransferase
VFAAAAVLLHAGFSLLSAYFRETAAARRQRCDFLLWTGVCTASACAAGVVLNRAVRHSGDAHPALFPVFGICALIAGILFAAPPAALGRRIGGEFAAAVGLGMLPVLGAYIVQAGGLTRTVYLASLPMAAATGLWVWVEELAAWREDEAAGRRTTVLHFGPGRSGRYGVPAIALVWAAAWAAAVASKSVSPLALAALPSAGLLWQIAAVFRAEHISAQAAGRARFCAFALHFATCAIIAVSSLLTPFG